MTSAENERITRVGPGTPLGKLMRRYWHPIALSSQIAEPDGPPLTTWLLGERFVVFRDSSGTAGVLNDACMHRGVSLGLGRVEDGGIRCLYHGWKFDAGGNILDTPNHGNCGYREKMRAPAYPVYERSGLVWTYIGPPALRPPIRTFEFDTVPATSRTAIRANCKASYLSLWEGGVDSSHVGTLHTNAVRPSWTASAKGEPAAPSMWDSLAPSCKIEDTDYGYRYVAFRALPDDPETRHARQTAVMMPYMRIIPGRYFDIAFCEVPMSDTETATYQIAYNRDRPVDRGHALSFLGFDSPLYDEATCTIHMTWPFGMAQDRSIMKTNWSGYQGIEFEDVAMSLSLTEWDRTKENLVAADLAVRHLRELILRAIDNDEAGLDPVGSSIADMTGVVAYDRHVKNTEDWKSLAVR